MLAGVAKKDTNSLDALYRCCAGKLLGIQIRILKNKELAEDALQEAFVKIWENASRYESDKSEAAVWLNSVARNTALDALRKIRLRTLVNVTLFDPDLVQNTQRSIAQTLGDRHELNICLDTLSEDSRRCLVSVYCEGYTSAEMSESMGRSESTIKSWLRRGLLALKECLDELG